MSITSQNLINGALQDMGRIAPGETPTVAASNAAFIILNELLSSWSRDGDIAYVEKVNLGFLVANLDVYTIGVGGSLINTAAYPQKVKGGRCSFLGFQSGFTVMPMADFERSIDNPIGMT